MENLENKTKEQLFDEILELRNKLSVFDKISQKITYTNVERLSRIFKDSLNEIYLFDSTTLKFSEVNDAAINNLGYSMAELREMTPLNFKTEFSLESFTKLVEPLRNGTQEKIVFETVHQRKNQSLYNVEVHLQLMEFENEAFFAAVILDITDRKKAEKEIQEKTIFLDKIIESSALSTWISDKNGTAIRTNQACLEFFGATSDEVIGKYNIFEDQVIEEHGYMPKIKDVFEKGDVANIILDYDFGAVGNVEAKNAKHKIINSIITPVLDLDGKVSNVIFQTIDLTEIFNAEKTTLIQKQTLANILEGTNAGTWDWNIQTGAVVLNERWAEIMGKTLEELQPIDINTWINAVHPDDLPEANSILQQLFNQEIDYYDVEFRQPHKNGSWVWVNARGKVVEWSKDGKPLQMSGTHLEITTRKMVEEELKQHRLNLEELVNVRTLELETKNKELDNAMKVFVGREITIRDLQKRIKALEGK